jgi:hypothetical protein
VFFEEMSELRDKALILVVVESLDDLLAKEECVSESTVNWAQSAQHH